MRTPDFVTCGGLITRNHDELQVKLSKVKANYGNRCQGAEAPVPYIQEGHVLLHFSSVVAGMGTGGGAGETEISCNDVMDFTEYVTH